MQEDKFSFLNLKSNKTLFLIVAIIIVIVLIFLFKNKNTNPDSIFGEQKQENTNIEETNKFLVTGKVEDLVYISVIANQEIPKSIFSFTGKIKGGWFFEGNILINILDENKKILKAGHATAKTDWMTSGVVDFAGNIDLKGLPSGPAYFEIHNDNASGEAKFDKSIQIPIVIK